MRYFEQMQQRITGFITRHSGITAERFTQLMMNTEEMVLDVGTVLDGETAVREGLIDQMGTLGDALGYLYDAIEHRRTRAAGTQKKKTPPAAKEK